MGETKWGRVLVSGDRDEHVRISVWPETWVIWGMGMGHGAFVSCLEGVRGGVVSGGGDGKVMMWDWDGGKRGECGICEGSCVRVVRGWRDLLFVVGERYCLQC